MKLTSSFIALALALTAPLSVYAQDVDVEVEASRHGGGKGGPLVTSKSFANTVSGRNLLDHAREYVKFSQLSNGQRSFGTAGHNATVNYIKTQLDKTGYYNTYLQTFPYLYAVGTSQLTAGGTEYADAQWPSYAPTGDVNAPIVLANNVGCDPADFPSTVEGKIVLIQRGTCSFGQKVALAGASKAAGAIIYDNVEAGPLFATLGGPTNPLGPYVPAATLTLSEGTVLVALIGEGEVTGRLLVDATIEDRYSSNVIATTKGGDKNNIVFAGGHSDSVPTGPGINDDGSGTMALLELALQLPRFSVKNAVRFGFWTAEEFGLVGSEHYVTNLPAEEQQKIAVYLNFDMIASPNPGYFVYDGDGSAFGLSGPAGSDHIERTFASYLNNTLKIHPGETAFDGRSDYGPFLDIGVPSGGLFTGAEDIKTPEEAALWGGQAGEAYDKCYHLECDGISNLNVDAWVANTKAAAHAIAAYARSLDGIPRGPRPANSGARVAKMSHSERLEFHCGGEHKTFSI